MGGSGIGRTRLVAGLQHVTALTGLTVALVAATWLAIEPAAGSVGAAPQTPVRGSGVARMRALAPAPSSGLVTVDIDGIRLAAAVGPGLSVAGLLADLGIGPAASDRVSAPLDAAVVPGMRLSVRRGLPLTLVDGGIPVPLRAQRQTAGELVAVLGIQLGPLDRLEPSADAVVGPDTVVRIVRVSERQISETEELPFGLVRRGDPSLEQGVESVVAAGQPGRAVRTYLVRLVDGLEADRTLLSETELAAPVDEVRAVGVRPRPAPRAPAEIEAIVRAAADRWGADASTLLRVAWCESRYSPSAYNYRSGASGLFQFMPATFARNSVRAGFDGASIWDPVASANTAAMLFASGQAGQWACK